MKLLIAIPALNEEESIDAIIRRSIEAREFICANSPITEVDITVVSDGSTDRTVERASQYTDSIDLIVFPQNKGYGAAIKEAWKRSDADLLGFLDADGTCEPRFFATLCEIANTEKADVVLGCRLNANSRMPLIRRVGNLIFATILSVFSSSHVRDTASGMRVVRRSRLDHLYPLPDGLQFTPAMSARAMLSGIRIVEVDMPYHERAGESKLRVAKDGLRFLKVILETAFLYRPSRPLGLLAIALVAFATLLMVSPILYYVEHGAVAERMIYRFLVSDLLGVAGCLCLCASYLTGRMTSIALTEELSGGAPRWSARLFQSRWFWTVPITFAAGAISLVFASFFDRITTGLTYEHWSRYVVMSFLFAVAINLSVTRIIDYVLNLVGSRLDYLKSQRFESQRLESQRLESERFDLQRFDAAPVRLAGTWSRPE